MSDQRTTQPGTLVYFKSWHIILMLVIQLIGIGIAYGDLRRGQDDMKQEFERRMTALENRQFVGRDEYDGFKSDLRDTLDRIESEIVERNKTEKLLK